MIKEYTKLDIIKAIKMSREHTPSNYNSYIDNEDIKWHYSNDRIINTINNSKTDTIKIYSKDNLMKAIKMAREHTPAYYNNFIDNDDIKWHYSNDRIIDFLEKI